MIDIKEQSPLSLAFVGDAVYSLSIRQRIVNRKKMSLGKLNSIAIRYVSATGQYEALKLLENVLTPEEADWVRRGRNSSKSTVPKNADTMEYRASTGFECMLGYLFLSGETKRIDYLVDYILEKMPF